MWAVRWLKAKWLNKFKQKENFRAADYSAAFWLEEELFKISADEVDKFKTVEVVEVAPIKQTACQGT